jgi:hypothetical protein
MYGEYGTAMVRGISVEVSTHELDVDCTRCVSGASLKASGLLRELKPEYLTPLRRFGSLIFGPETCFQAHGFKHVFRLDTFLEHRPSSLYLLLLSMATFSMDLLERLRGLVLTSREDGRLERVGLFVLAHPSENKAFDQCKEILIEIV